MRPSAPNVESIGKYQIQKVIGRGAMGTVYEALDPSFQRKVALKTVSPREGDAPELRARFLREAQAAGRLRHPNIVTVYDVRDENGQPYIAMEYVEGTDLERIIQEKRPLPVEWKIDVLRQELKSYLAEEGARRTAEALTATAQEHLVPGNLDEAVAAGEGGAFAQPHPTPSPARSDSARGT